MPNPFPLKGTKGTGPDHSGCFVDQNKEITVKEKELNHKDLGDPHFFQGHANRMVACGRNENQGGSDGHHEPQQDREKGDPASRDSDRPHLEEHLLVKQGIEYPDEDGKRSGQHHFSQEIPDRQISENDQKNRVDQKGNER